jgi:phosphotransferase system enzyme I (PtsI)
MLARMRGVPMVVGVEGRLPDADTMVIVDAHTGRVIVEPDQAARVEYIRQSTEYHARCKTEMRHLLEPARRKDGTRIELMVNMTGVDELQHIDVRCCDGIGLMRSEFLFRDGAALPTEDQQYQAFKRFVEWAQGRPVTIRTLDIGGDKPIAGLTPQGERNPFLGLRGVRLTLAHRDVFRTQLRALARAAALGSLKVMIPMVTVPEEISRTAELLDECVADLTRQGVDCAKPPLGIMVEVPAVAIAPELFQEAQFFSIGSNDLTQYVTAASRDDAGVAALNNCEHPAVTRLIASVVRYGLSRGMPVSLCGDMASETVHLKTLLDAGLTSLSVAPSRVARLKAALAEL